jgi:DNA-binding transcriptional regulator/RsmH inhibitor MraZ
VLPTSALSSKNQVTVPKEARALLEGDDPVFYGLPHYLPGEDDPAAKFPFVLMFSAAELKRREQAIRDDATKPSSVREALATKLRALAAPMAVDDYSRVVLPAHLVAHLAVEKKVFFIAMNDAVRVWNPDTFRQWAGLPEEGAVAPYTPALDDYLF